MTSGKVDMRMCALQKSNKLHVSSRLFRLVYKKLSHSKIKSQHPIAHCEFKGYKWKNRGKHAGVCFLLQSSGLLFRKDTTTADKITAFQAHSECRQYCSDAKAQARGNTTSQWPQKGTTATSPSPLFHFKHFDKGLKLPPTPPKKILCRLMPHFRHAAN